MKGGSVAHPRLCRPALVVREGAGRDAENQQQGQSYSGIQNLYSAVAVNVRPLPVNTHTCW